MSEELMDEEQPWIDLSTCFHHVPFRYACAECGRKDDPEPVLRATIDALTAQVATLTAERDEALRKLRFEHDMREQLQYEVIPAAEKQRGVDSADWQAGYRACMRDGENERLTLTRQRDGLAKTLRQLLSCNFALPVSVILVRDALASIPPTPPDPQEVSDE